MAPPINRGKKSSKNPPILSHEFIIQNHGDIVSCFTMVIIAGLFLEVTSPFAMVFISLQHNITLENEYLGLPEGQKGATFYQYGKKDLLTIFFYSLIFVVAHAIIQEYLLDKWNRRMHLSKVKHSLFNESGQLAFFSLFSAGLGAWILVKENYVKILSALWATYPHHKASFWLKMFVILQLAYWLHCYYELYFQKIKKDDILRRVKMYTIHLVVIAAAYFVHYTLLFLFLATFHYAAEALFHISKLLHYAEKHLIADFSFKLWKIVFVAVRLLTITFSVIVIWFGMAKEGVDEIDWEMNNFNTFYFRVTSLAVVFAIEAWIMWDFITFHVRKVREGRHEDDVKKSVSNVSKSQPSKNKKNKGDGEYVKGEEGSYQNGGAKHRNPKSSPKVK